MNSSLNYHRFILQLVNTFLNKITLTFHKGWWGRGEEGGEEKEMGALARAGARTQDLPHARGESSAARHGVCFDK